MSSQAYGQQGLNAWNIRIPTHSFSERACQTGQKHCHCVAGLQNSSLGLRLQHWDIAFSEKGPVLMELNTEADLGVPQYLGGKAFATDSIDALMASRPRD